MKKKIVYLMMLGLQIIPLPVFAGNAAAMRRISQTMKNSNTTAMQMVALLDEAAEAGQDQWISANITIFVEKLKKENSEGTLAPQELQNIKTATIRAIKKIKKRKKHLLDYILAHFAPLKVDEMKRIFVIADIEGNWEKVRTFVDKSDAIFFENPDDHHGYKATIQGKNVQLVFLGDSIDKGPNSMQALQFLIHLKKRYKSQVALIMGNRDINKLRFYALSELSEKAFRLSGWEGLFNEWLTGKLNKKTGEMQKLNLVDGNPTLYTGGILSERDQFVTDKILKLKFFMQETLGAGMTFDRNTGEITSTQNAFDDFKKEINAQTDLETFNKYMEFVGPNGLITQYLQLAELIHFDKETGTLFMHGGISNENLGYIPPTKKDGPDAHYVENNIPQWVKTLNHWAQDRIQDCLKQNVEGALPLIELQEPTVIEKDDGLKYWDANIPNAYSVVQVRPWGPDKNLIALDINLVKKLRKLGVNKIVFGHSPVGEVPVIIKGHQGFISVAADTSYARAQHPRNPAIVHPRNAAIVITKDDVTVYADYYEHKDGKEIKNELIYSSKDPRVGTATVIDGKTYWNISPMHDGKDMLQGTWAAPAVTYQIEPIAPAA